MHRFIVLLLILPLCAAASSEVRLAADGKSVTHVAWDTEDDGRMANLLRDGTAISGASFSVKQAEGGGFDLTMAGPGASVTFPFDPRVSAVTILPARTDADAAFHFPVIVSAPGFGAMRVETADDVKLASTLVGSRRNKTVDWTLKLPDRPSVTLQFRPCFVPAPKGLDDPVRWKLARRAWLNQFQVSAKWGDPGHPVSAPAGVLANNVISDPVTCLLFVYADAALMTPQLAPGISAMYHVGRTLDWWIDERMLPTGEIPGYWDKLNFLDANPSILITAWDYAESTGDRKWLADRIDKLEKAAQFMASRDVDHDGLLEAVQSGNPNTLIEPARSCSAYDAINCGYKDAYCNAIAYRAFRCMADLEKQLDRNEQADHYAQLADRLKAAYAKTLTVPATGWIGWWRAQDGELHDLASPLLNGLAVDYDLIVANAGRDILRRLREKMVELKFTRFDVGLPCTLVPVRRSEYLQPSAPGLATKEDGSDMFGQYLNGGVLPGDTLRYLSASYAVGEREFADKILDAMLARIPKGDFAAGGFATSIVDVYPGGAEFFTWDAKPCGYEGLLSHAYHFLQAVPMRDEAIRRRVYRPLYHSP